MLYLAGQGKGITLRQNQQITEPPASPLFVNIEGRQSAYGLLVGQVGPYEFEELLGDETVNLLRNTYRYL
jgi:hypothetical protein